MGKISNYASALKAKLTDYFVIASDNNGVLETKKVTTEQIGDAVASDQTHSLLDTSDKTLIGGINEVNSGVGNSVKRYTTSWGTICQTTIGRYQFIVMRGASVYVVWLASTNDINVTNIGTNAYISGTGSATLDNTTFTRLSNNNLKVELSSNGTITIFG